MSAGCSSRSKPSRRCCCTRSFRPRTRTSTTHHGIAIDGVIRALRDNIAAKIDGNDSIQGGGSTITQQVAKNFLLNSEQTWDRKIQEAILALRIDSTFSKDKILELYVNEIFLGLNSYGVAAAALNYFDKALYQLDLSEIAYIAGLPKGPNNYHPFKHPQAAIERRNYVLDRMAENGYITPAEARRRQGRRRSTSCRASRAASSIRPNTSPRKSAASSPRSMARTSSMAAACRCAPRSSPSCRNTPARR